MTADKFLELLAKWLLALANDGETYASIANDLRRHASLVEHTSVQNANRQRGDIQAFFLGQKVSKEQFEGAMKLLDEWHIHWATAMRESRK
mgnify:CR=1 FL=1